MSYSDSRKDSILSITNCRCYYCGCELSSDKFCVDHFKEQEGKPSGRLVPACVECNKAKSYMTVEQFRERLQNVIFTNLYSRITSHYIGVPIPEKVTFYYEKAGL